MTEFIIQQIQLQNFMGLLCLVGVFFYIGLITIGGGQVGITVMHQVIVDNFSLLTEDKFFNMVAISESTPGPIGINMATYIGTELYGVFGGVFTTLGQVLPSLIVIIIIARFFSRFTEKKLVQSAFSTLRPAVSGVIAVAAARVIVLALISVSYQSGLRTGIINTAFYLVCLCILFRTKLHPVFIVSLGAVFGILFC